MSILNIFRKKSVSKNDSLLTISNYVGLFEKMKAFGFFDNPNEQVESFINNMRVGVNRFSNGEVQFSIIRGLDGRDKLDNSHDPDHPVMIKIFNVA